MTRETRARRAPRNEPHLIVNRSGVHCIAWGRAVARAAGLGRVESLGTTDRRAAELKMRERQAEVFTSLGDDRRADRVRRQLFPIGMRAMVSTFLRALAAGELPPLPAKKTLLDMYIPGMMGRSGFCDFAESVGAVSSTDMTAALVERWLDQLRVKGLSADTLRLRRQCARRLAQFATMRGHISEAAAGGILAVKRVRGARGRARTDGVPSLAEVMVVLSAMSPVHWQKLAEVQLRLGLRRSEVLALRADWVDERRSVVRVRISADFTTKDCEERIIEADAITLGLAADVARLLAARKLTATGYRMAWRRALAVAAKAGIAWRYRAKSHALRQLYATHSAAAGIPVKLVADRLGHSSVRVTEAHYLGRLSGEHPATPFDGVAALGAATTSTVPAKGARRLRVVGD